MVIQYVKIDPSKIIFKADDWNSFIHCRDKSVIQNHPSDDEISSYSQGSCSVSRVCTHVLSYTSEHLHRLFKWYLFSGPIVGKFISVSKHDDQGLHVFDPPPPSSIQCMCHSLKNAHFRYYTNGSELSLDCESFDKEIKSVPLEEVLVSSIYLDDVYAVRIWADTITAKNYSQQALFSFMGHPKCTFKRGTLDSSWACLVCVQVVWDKWETKAFTNEVDARRFSHTCGKRVKNEWQTSGSQILNETGF